MVAPPDPHGDGGALPERSRTPIVYRIISTSQVALVITARKNITKLLVVRLRLRVISKIAATIDQSTEDRNKAQNIRPNGGRSCII